MFFAGCKIQKSILQAMPIAPFAGRTGFFGKDAGHWISQGTFSGYFSICYLKRQFFDETLLTGPKSGSISRVTEREAAALLATKFLVLKKSLKLAEMLIGC
ncbi:hypothetical protein ACWKW9_22670, partial [Rhizobium daejeonense]